MKIITLCGSNKFWEEFIHQNFIQTLNGNIVFTMGGFREIISIIGNDYSRYQNNGLKENYPYHEDITINIKHDISPEEKELVDQVHLQKIRLSDEIFVINKYGYIGESTKREMAFAFTKHKVVNFLEPELGDKYLEDNSHEMGQLVSKFMMAEYKRPEKR